MVGTLASDIGEYVIVADVVETLAYKYGVRDAVSNPELKSRIKKLEAELYAKMKEMVTPNLTVKIIEAADLAERILSVCNKIDPDAVIVCLDRSYFPDKLHVNPTAEFGNKIVAHYNFPSLTTEADKIEAELKGRAVLNGGLASSIILVDTGINEGDTLTKIIRLLEIRGVKISGIVSGLTSDRGKDKLQKAFKHEITSIEPATWRKWTDGRDLFLIDGPLPPERLRSNVREFIPITDAIDEDSRSFIRDEMKERFKELCALGNTRLFSTLKEFGIDTKVIGEHISIETIKKRSLAIR